MSRPARARGLKHPMQSASICDSAVAPRAGAWIETTFLTRKSAGMWSRPARARGLKRNMIDEVKDATTVAPRAGAWIETATKNSGHSMSRSRAPRGRVD